MKEEDWEVLDHQALGTVILTLARNVAFNIMDQTTTKGLIEALSIMYGKASAMNKVYLMRRLFDLNMVDSTSVADYINEFNMIITQLAFVKIIFEDEIRP